LIDKTDPSGKRVKARNGETGKAPKELHRQATQYTWVTPHPDHSKHSDKSDLPTTGAELETEGESIGETLSEALRINTITI